jgi:uncharacterized membrane protein YedE/YeeE
MNTVPTHDALAAWPEPAARTEAAAVDRAEPYMNPYVAGVGLGLVLLASFVLVGRGLGASGAVNSFVAWIVNAIAPSHAQHNGFLAEYLGDGSVHPLKAWLVFEIGGVFVGAMVSGLLAHRAAFVVEKGARVSVAARLAMAFAGGALMGIGAAFARGCTSGQALTGGSLLNLGSWVTMLAIFGGGYALAYFVRWQWSDR